MMIRKSDVVLLSLSILVEMSVPKHVGSHVLNVRNRYNQADLATSISYS